MIGWLTSSRGHQFCPTCYGITLHAITSFKFFAIWRRNKRNSNTMAASMPISRSSGKYQQVFRFLFFPQGYIFVYIRFAIIYLYFLFSIFWFALLSFLEITSLVLALLVGRFIVIALINNNYLTMRLPSRCKLKIEIRELCTIILESTILNVSLALICPQLNKDY